MIMLDGPSGAAHPEKRDESPGASRPPASASGVLTGAGGVAAALVSATIFHDWQEAPLIKVLCVLCISAAVMIAIDVCIYRVQSNESTELERRPLRSLDMTRVVWKSFGLWITIGIVALLYVIIPEYQRDLYEPFLDASLLAIPFIIILSPIYIAYVDCRQRDPLDVYLQVSMLLRGRRPDYWGPLRAHALGWLVKAFFLPLMFAYVYMNLITYWKEPVPSPFEFEKFFAWCMNVFFLIDVLLATISYALTLRLLDNHIRSVEPTLGGWLACVICYQPLADAQSPYIQYEQDSLYWGAVFAPYPWIYVLWGGLILVLHFVYVWSTVAFGLRFSNLTNRGIITSGPYRWLKHPAYLSKNLSWWLISVPFVAGAGWATAVISCLMLGAVNFIYYLRAKTEERHLRVDQAYRAYEDYIEKHGLFACLFAKELQR